MFASLRRRFEYTLFDMATRAILRSPPARPEGGAAHVVSMVQSGHLRLYLLAIKSFLQQVPAGAVTVLDDGSLTPADHALLRDHVAGLSILPLASVDTGPCPRGGCWERLLFILDLSASTYVVQLDSDVLTARPIPEVVEAIARNHAFTLGTGAEFARVTTAEAAEAMAGADPGIMQVAVEQALPRLPAGLGTQYIRGSAGFAGFARGGPGRAVAEAFSAAMEAELGERWKLWGTEQITSNFLVANSPGGDVLPWPKYRCFYGAAAEEGAALLHFLGTWRFDRGVYLRLARRVAAELGREATGAAA